jgi:hypothetical protein
MTEIFKQHSQFVHLIYYFLDLAISLVHHLPHMVQLDKFVLLLMVDDICHEVLFPLFYLV